MAEPIWKDYHVALGSGDSYFYRIRLGSAAGSVVYSGKAYRRPGADSVDIRINDICADYISQTLPTLSADEFDAIVKPLVFVVQRSSNGTSWTVVDTVSFVNNWSYDYGYADSLGMCFPVTGRVDRRMWMTHSFLTSGSKTMTVDGVQKTLALAVDEAFAGSSFERAARSCGAGSAVFSLDGYPSARSIVIGNVTYTIVDGCAEYALYYVNAYGGMDMLMIEGNAVERDIVDRMTTGVDYDNGHPSNRGEQDFMNDITKEWTLYSGLLTDAESLRMHNLFNSPEVYLYDIAMGLMHPVIVTTTEHDYKTYRNQGRTLNNYEIGVRLANIRQTR